MTKGRQHTAQSQSKSVPFSAQAQQDLAQHLAEFFQRHAEAILDKTDATNTIKTISKITNNRNQSELKSTIENAKWSISAFSNELLIQFDVQLENQQQAVDQKLTTEYSYGQLEFKLSLFSIFQDGEPIAQLYFEENKCTTNQFYIQVDGLEYALQFYGELFIHQGWIILDGVFKSSYMPDPIFSVNLAFQLSVQDLDWSNYRFDYSEVNTAQPEHVTALIIRNPEFDTLPDDVYSFRHLKHLTIQCHRTNPKQKPFQQQPLALKHISPRIAALTQLESISINNALIEQLPDEIVQLRALNTVNFSLCRLKSLPETFWQLPALKFLFLSGNHISDIPESLNLPNLRSLNVEYNQLKTLPIALSKMPELINLYARGNPFEYLDNAFKYFQPLQLDFEEKKALFDFSYMGVDGCGVIDWDDKLFQVDLQSENDFDDLMQIQNIIEQSQFKPLQKPILDLLKRSILFHQCTAAENTISENKIYENTLIETGRTHFGGMPDLPLSMHYPTFQAQRDGAMVSLNYEFLAQINCEALANLQQFLPRTGTLFFFIKSLHHVGELDSTQVIYVKDNQQLASSARFKLAAEDYFDAITDQYQRFDAEVSLGVSFPSFYALDYNDYLLKSSPATLKKALKDHADAFYEQIEAPIEQLSTHDHGINVYGFTQHQSPELQAATVYGGEPEDWLIVLKVASRGDFQWSDAGDLFFVMHKSDLLQCDFRRIFACIESS
ncbi:Leucine Rich repeat-containing protein [Acinetobacter marinus]|uniref:Leucine Rich repeat-containing protein n=1 Tax=Acinetobacter marinus TaxID=281375 RepID=A0A1G6GLG6_9GAMM|nr:DUF1963 domain-containing protein [Acinetobacter marinus]SDB82872.1 Leucine Rich repeat-containing protein [Acinetobacter marinus]